MGSLVVKIDDNTASRIESRNYYSDIDMLKFTGNVEPTVPMAYDVEAVKIAVRNILMWRVGESVISPEFGHNLKLSMYQQMNQFNEDAVGEEIKRAIEDNEPRAQIESVAVAKDDDNSNALRVRVKYTVVGKDSNDSAEFVEHATIFGK